MDSMNNIYANAPNTLPNEVVEILTDHGSVRIERIVSSGQSSPDGFWYDQDEHEWVVVLKGEARLRIEGEDHPTLLRSGDFINIPAHQKHRVEWTSPEMPTVWLAVFYRD